MAKKKEIEAKQYIVLIGCNTADETRYEPGDPIFSDVGEEEIAGLLEAGAIEECQ